MSNANRTRTFYFVKFTDDNKPSYLGFGSNHTIPHVTPQRPLEFLIDLYREHSSTRPFCDSIFGLKEQMVALQLVMAQLNKQVIMTVIIMTVIIMMIIIIIINSYYYY